MKKTLLFFCLLFATSFAHGQGDITYWATDPTGQVCTTTFASYQGFLYTCIAGHYAKATPQNLPTGGVIISTVAKLPAGQPLGTPAVVTDGAGSTDCTVGGGSTLVFCRWGGSSWGTFPAGSASAGGLTGQGQYNNSGALGGWTASGDCTINFATGVVTCTKTNGTSFAPSATTDTTNATNISSGTLNNSRLPSSINISGGMTASSFSGTGNAFSGTEASSSSIACALGIDVLWADSVSHWFKMCLNNGSSVPLAASDGTMVNGNLPKATGPNSLTDSGVASANLVTASAAASAAKQTCISSGTSKSCTYISFPDAKIVPFAAAPGGTAVSGVTYASGQWTPTLRAGTNNIGAALQAIPSTGAALQFVFELPADWDTTQQPFISIFYASGANTTGTVIWTVSSACSKQDGSVTDDPAFIAESAFASQTMASANVNWAKSGQFTAMTSLNNCIPGSPVMIKVALSGTAASAINAKKAVITIPRLLTVQAE